MKAQFYSFLSIVIIIPILIFISLYVVTQSGKSGIYENIVADQIHQVTKNLENDFERAMVTSGKRALIAGSDYVVINGRPLSNAVLNIKELMENGTIEGNESIIMINNTLDYWFNKIMTIPFNFNISINFSDLNISENGSFGIKISAKLNLSVKDSLGIASISKKDEIYNVIIKPEGMEDPIFALNTNGLVKRSIKISPFPYRAKKLVAGGTNSSGSCLGNITFDKNECYNKILVAENTSGVNFACFSGFVLEESINLSSYSDCYITGNNSALENIKQALNETNYEIIYIDGPTHSVWHLPIREEIENKYYFEGSGPTFLKRLENNLNQTTNGMESFVNLPELQSYQIPIKENVISVDYIYFGSQNYIGHPIRGLQTWFRLNKTFTDKYGLTELCNGC
jgi:hypothetical protein